MTSNNIALVTGGTGGLGTAICQALSEQGYLIFANYHPADEANAKKWQSEQSARGLTADIIAADAVSYTHLTLPTICSV